MRYIGYIMNDILLTHNSTPSKKKSKKSVAAAKH